MTRASRDLLQEITNANGTSGFEAGIAAIVAKHLEGIGSISYDNLGSIICEKTGDPQGPKIMLAGHMDEIGFMVKLITKEGFIKFAPLGGWWSQVLLAQRVAIETSKGSVIGIIGSKPPHLLPPDQRNKLVEINEMFIDVGAKDKDEAESTFGIRPGDPVYPDMKFAAMAGSKHFLAKAWDDRVGVALMIDTLKALKDAKHPNVLFGVGTVQEEVGLRGAQTSVQSIGPDVGIVLEAGIAGDMPGVTEDESNIKLGEGAIIEILDGSMIAQSRLRDLVIETAKSENMPYQFGFIERGGTDAGKVHLHARGVPSIVICVATRYIHSHAGIIHGDDYAGALKLVLALCKRLDAKTVAKLTTR